MKLKTLLLIGLFVIPLFSCEEKSEVNITQTQAELLLEIPISNEISQLKSINFGTNNTFTGTCSFCLADSENLNDCSNILRISLENGCVLSFFGIEACEQMKTCELEWGFCEKNSDQFKMQIPIDLKPADFSYSNGKVNVNLDTAFLPLIKNMSTNPNRNFKISVKGVSELPLSAQLFIPIVIESGNISPRFSLF